MYATIDRSRTAAQGLLLLALAALLALTLLLGSCGGTAAGPVSSHGDGFDGLAFREGAELNLDPASFELGGSGRVVLGFPEQQADGCILLPILGEELAGLKSLYCTLDYDSQHYRAVQFRPAKDFDTEGAGLSLAILDQPGSAEIGMVLKKPQDCAGLSGDVRLGLLKLQPLAGGQAMLQTSLPAVQRRASQAPEGPAVDVQLSYYPGNQQLRWYYSNPGDYNQDGRVAVSDLTQIGLHFGETGPWGIEEALSVVDGNSDGKITVADLTVIGLNYGRRVDAYRVCGSTAAEDYPDGSGAQIYAELSLEDASRTVNERVSFIHEMDASGMLLWVLPADGDSTGSPSNVVNGSGANIAPTVTLSSDYDGAPAPAVINLTASASDLDGSIVKYEFDLDGVGNLEVDNGLDNTAQITASSSGSYKTRVRVTDNLGATAIVTLFIDVQSDAPNADPTVNLQSDISTGPAPLAVHLSAFASDSDGSVVNYAFNCDGQAGDEYSGPLSGFDWTFTEEGLHVVWVTVTDDRGATAMDSVDIQVGEPLGLPPLSSAMRVHPSDTPR